MGEWVSVWWNQAEALHNKDRLSLDNPRFPKHMLIAVLPPPNPLPSDLIELNQRAPRLPMRRLY